MRCGSVCPLKPPKALKLSYALSPLKVFFPEDHRAHALSFPLSLESKLIHQNSEPFCSIPQGVLNHTLGYDATLILFVGLDNIT